MVTNEQAPAGTAWELSRIAAVGGTIALIILGVSWETVVAPLRPGSWQLALKVVPAALLLPGMIAGRLRSFQWMSMLVLLYTCEGIVRTLSDSGPSSRLAALEIALSVIVYVGVLLWVRARLRRNRKAQ